MNFKKHALLALLSLMAISFAYSQKVEEFQVNFETAKFNLTLAQEKKIDSVISLLTNIPDAYGIDITGHTDNVGSLDYNKNLAIQRANAIAGYFATKGFGRSKMKTSGKDYSQPIADNESEKGKSRNRRVTVEIRVDIPKIHSISGVKLQNDKYMVFADSGMVIQHKSGTKIVIPPKAFVDKNGQPVTGRIEIVYQEYRDPIDFLLSGIPMDHVSDNSLFHFNSAGMFKILAFKEKQPISLAVGKTIQMDFAMNKYLPNLNFYRFDTVANKWDELKKLTGNEGRNFGIDWPSNRLNCLPLDDKRIGEVGPFIDSRDFYFLVNTGLLFAGNNFSMARLANNSTRNSDSLLTTSNMLDSIADDIDSLNQLIKGKTNTYRTTLVSKSKSKLVFHLESDEMDSSEINAYSDVNWVYTKRNLTIAEIANIIGTWDSCKIEDKETHYSLVLKDSTRSIVLESLSFKPKDKIKKKELPDFRASMNDKYSGLFKDRNQNVLKWKSRRDNKNDTIDDVLIGLYSASVLKYFWEKSEPYMSLEEIQLSFTEWAAKFDTTKTEMLERYKALMDSTEWFQCIKTLYPDDGKRKLSSMIKQIHDYVDKKPNDPNTDELSSSSKRRSERNSIQKISRQLKGRNDRMNEVADILNISILGIYNCDQLAQLSNPVTISANYLDEKNNEILPIAIYLIDSKINGVLIYNGYMGYGPKKFAFSPASKNVLLAEDQNGTWYICAPSEFGNIKIPLGKKQHTFIMYKVRSRITREELQKLIL